MLKVTVNTIIRTFEVTRDKVKQIKSQQLFIVDSPYLGRLLVSYRTIVGVFHGGVWVISTEKHSVSTSRQVNSFTRSTPFEVQRVDAETFSDLLDAIARE